MRYSKLSMDITNKGSKICFNACYASTDIGQSTSVYCPLTLRLSRTSPLTGKCAFDSHGAVLNQHYRSVNEKVCSSQQDISIY